MDPRKWLGVSLTFNKRTCLSLTSNSTTTTSGHKKMIVSCWSLYWTESMAVVGVIIDGNSYLPLCKQDTLLENVKNDGINYDPFFWGQWVSLVPKDGRQQSILFLFTFFPISLSFSLLMYVLSSCHKISISLFYCCFVFGSQLACSTCQWTSGVLSYCAEKSTHVITTRMAAHHVIHVSLCIRTFMISLSPPTSTSNFDWQW